MSEPPGVLVELGPSPTPVVNTLRVALPPGPFAALTDFALATPGGRLVRFETLTWSLEDDLGVTTHAIVGDELRSLTVVLVTTARGRTRTDGEVRLRGLAPLPDDDPRAREARRLAGAPRER